VEGTKSPTAASKKATITLAIDENVLSIIRKDAERDGLSINSKINNLLKKYAYFGKHIERQHPTVITSRNLQFILDNIDEKILATIFQTIIIHLMPAEIFKRNFPLTLGNWMNYVCEGILLNSGMIQKFSTYKDKDDHLYLVFTHNNGIKWTRVLTIALTQLLRDMLNYHVRSTISSSSVTLKILEIDMLDIR
jgi:hypothetical protein